MEVRHAAAALAWAALLTAGNVHVTSVLAPPTQLQVAAAKPPSLVMQTRSVAFESRRSADSNNAAVIPDHMVSPSPEQAEDPRLPPPRTHRGWVSPVTDADLLPNPIQAGWFQGWTVALSSGESLERPAVQDGAVYIGGGADSRKVHSLDAETGIPLWTVRLSASGTGPPTVSGRYVALTGGTRTIFVISTFDGSLQWSHRFEKSVSSRPVAIGDDLFFSHDNGDSTVFTSHSLATGDVRWNAPLDGSALDGAVLADGWVYVTTSQGSIYCLDAITGHEKWSEPLGAWSSILAEGAHLLTACANPWPVDQKVDAPGLLRITLSSGLPFERVVWGPRETSGRIRLVSRLSVGLGFSGVPAAGYPSSGGARREATGRPPSIQDPSDGAKLSRPWSSGADVCLAARDAIRCADLQTGSVRWEWRPPRDEGPASIAGSPAIDGDLVVVVSSRGDLAGLRRSGGDDLWALRLGEPVTAGPVLANGWVYVTTSEGRIFGVNLLDPGTSDHVSD